MTDEQVEFLDKAQAAAAAASHPFPQMAACEAALESAWGKSILAAEDNNIFGTKQHLHPLYGTVSLPTKEFLDERWQRAVAFWVKYPDWTTSFADRLDTLKRLAPHYPPYANALKAQDPETFVREVSKSWSTDPDRAAKCLAIYKEYTAI